MPETQDGNQIEQNQIAQFERAYKFRSSLRHLIRVLSREPREAKPFTRRHLGSDKIEPVTKAKYKAGVIPSGTGLARRLAVDPWRIHTGRCSAIQLGFII